MSLWVVGAGPIGALPDRAPRIVIFANGAVDHIRKFPHLEAKKWLLVASNVYPNSSSVLMYDHDKYSAADVNSHLGTLRGLIHTHSPYEKLIVRESLGFPAHNTIDSLRKLGLAHEFHAFTYREIMRSIRRFMNRYELYSMIIGPKKIGFQSLIRFAGRRRMLSGPFSKPSTGVLAVLLALKEVGPDEALHVLGVTFNDASYPFESSLPPERNAHINADMTLLSAIRKTLPEHRLFMHDEALRTATSWLDPSTVVD